MATFSKRGNEHRRLEHPDFTGGIPEKPGLSHEAPGNRPDGTVVPGTVRQPWVTEDGVAPDEPEKNIG
jgi:hypothetical protein